MPSDEARPEKVAPKQRKRRISFEWRLDPIALAALVISLFSFGWQGVTAWVPPTVSVEVMNRIFFVRHHNGNGVYIMRIALGVSHQSEGWEGRNAVVRKQWIELDFGQCTHVLEGSGLINPGGDAVFFVYQSLGTADTHLIEHGIPNSRNILFSPSGFKEKRNSCGKNTRYILWSEFEGLFTKSDQISFEYFSEIDEVGRLVHRCIIPRTEKYMEDFGSITDDVARINHDGRNEEGMAYVEFACETDDNSNEDRS